MARFILALVAVLTCSVLTSTAFGSPKGFFIGGSAVSRSASGDLDGKNILVDSNATLEGSEGKLDSGGGLAFDIGYNFGTHFGLEYLESHSVHTASHELEKSETDAFLSTSLLGFRLSAGLADSFDVFARLGVAVASLTYERYGHKGSFSPAFMPTSDKDFNLLGTGTGFGVGAEAVFGKHLGIGIGYTVYNITFDEGSIGDKRIAINKNKPAATFSTGDVTVLWHF